MCRTLACVPANPTRSLIHVTTNQEYISAAIKIAPGRQIVLGFLLKTSLLYLLWCQFVGLRYNLRKLQERLTCVND